jgi:DNA end-binding protein Ku
MVEIVGAIIERRSGAFDPASFRDLYQDALRELIEAKTKGRATTPRTIAEPPKVINPMEALKRSLEQDAEPEPNKAAGKAPRGKAVPDRRHRAMLLPVSGGREKTDAAVTEPAASTAPKRPKRA